jgi:hypothetical protein
MDKITWLYVILITVVLLFLVFVFSLLEKPE